MTYLDLPITEIDRHPGQPRKHFDTDALNELAGSIRSLGVLEPLLVRRVDGRYIIIAGERRWRASQLADLDVVPCRILDLSEQDAYVLSVAENVNRTDMSVLEETDAFAQLIAYGRDVAEIARLFGKTETYVRIRLSFASLVDEAKSAVERGDVRPWLARHLAELRPGNQRTVLNRYARGEFRNETEAATFAAALRNSEDEVGFFELEEPTEEDREIHAARSSAARRDLDKIATLSALLEEFASASPVDIAEALGADVTARAAQMERVTRLAQVARENLRKAKAHADARVIEVRG